MPASKPTDAPGAATGNETSARHHEAPARRAENPARRKPAHARKTDGHTATAAPLIGALSLVLVLGLDRIGLLAGINATIASWFSRDGAETFPNGLPAPWLWCGAAAASFGLPFALLATAGQWRRVLLWLLTLAALAFWAPVLALAAYAPWIAAPWIAALWAGVCSLVYTNNHRMSADQRKGGAA